MQALTVPGYGHRYRRWVLDSNGRRHRHPDREPE